MEFIKDIFGGTFGLLKVAPVAMGTGAYLGYNYPQQVTAGRFGQIGSALVGATLATGALLLSKPFITRFLN